jgi:hypothetical protein
MDSLNTLAQLNNQDATDASNITKTELENQEGRTYSQKEFDDHMARMKSAVLKKALKPYEELGDLEELRKLREQVQAKQLEDAKSRGEYDKIIQELAAKKDAEISKRDSIIREYRVDTPLIEAAANLKAVNAEQVKALLKSQVRLGDDNEVEIVDRNGSVRYNDSGLPMTVKDLVKEFLTTNPHFVAAGPSTSNGQSSIAPSDFNKDIDISKLDMANPQHRQLYKQAMAGRR